MSWRGMLEIEGYVASSAAALQVELSRMDESEHNALCTWSFSNSRADEMTKLPRGRSIVIRTVIAASLFGRMTENNQVWILSADTAFSGILHYRHPPRVIIGGAHLTRVLRNK